MRDHKTIEEVTLRLAIMQPYFFPYIGYFQAISAVDKYILYGNLNYITEGWMHRNRIIVINQGARYLSVSVNSKSSNKKIYEITLDPRIVWRKNILKTVYLNYKKAKHFEEIYPLVENVILSQLEYLHEYNSNCIKLLCEYLSMPTTIESENSSYYNLEESLISLQSDYQFDFTKPEDMIKTIRVLEICKKQKANVFVNAIGGTKLYNKYDFKKYGVDLYFVKTHDYSYAQTVNGFIPNLSIIDVLMNCGRDKTIKLISNYSLV